MNNNCPALLFAAMLIALPAAAQQGPTADAFLNCPHHSNEAGVAGDSCKYKQHRHAKGDDVALVRQRLAALELTEKQKQEFATLLQLYQPRVTELRKRGEAARQQLLSTIPGAIEYSALVDEVAAEASRTAGELVVLLSELQSNAYALLTPAQQSQWQELKLDLRPALLEKRMSQRGAKQERWRERKTLRAE